MIDNLFYYGLIILLPYFVGSIPFGYVFVKLTHRGDIRNLGSGNIGATNVLRTGSKGLALATLLFDMGKGYLCCYSVARWGHILTYDAYMTGVAVFLGHITCPWLKGKGGKGVATALGTFLCLNPICALVALLCWGGVAKYGKISSLAALSAFVMTTLFSCFYNQGEDAIFTGYSVLITLVICLTHRDNIKRLWHKKEPVIT